MEVPLAELRRMMGDVCLRSGVPDGDVDEVVAHFLEGELRGQPTHGVSKFCFESQFFPERLGPAEVVQEVGCLSIVDGRRDLGPLTARLAIQVAGDKAREFGVGLVGALNTQRYGVLSVWAERFADQGLIGIVMNTSRADVTVLGARRPFLGVNTLAFGVPATERPLVADFSSTRAPMGNLWDARRGDAPLRPESFVDGEGELSDDPRQAQWGLVPGDHRSLALSMLIQVLTGALFGFPMGTEVDSTWTTGYAFIAIDPALVGDLTQFRRSVSRFVEDAVDSCATATQPAVRVPGTRSVRLRDAALARGTVALTDSVYRRLVDLHAGAAGLPPREI